MFESMLEKGPLGKKSLYINEIGRVAANNSSLRDVRLRYKKTMHSGIPGNRHRICNAIPTCTPNSGFKALWMNSCADSSPAFTGLMISSLHNGKAHKHVN